MFSDLKSLPYEDRLHKLGLWTLEERLNRADLLKIFKMVNAYSETSCSQFFRRTEGVTSGTGSCIKDIRMSANAQRDGRPAEHRWSPLFNAAKFG